MISKFHLRSHWVWFVTGRTRRVNIWFKGEDKSPFKRLAVRKRDWTFLYWTDVLQPEQVSLLSPSPSMVLQEQNLKVLFCSCWEYENSGLSWTHSEKITSSSNSSSGTKKGMYSYYNFCLFFIVLREFFWKFRKNHESEMEVSVIQGVNPCYAFLLKYFEFLQWNIYNLIIMSKVFIFL